MKSKYVLQVIATLTVCVLSAFLAAGQSTKLKSKFPPGPCHQNIKRCVANMQSQLNVVRAYVQRVKPGDKVSFNPQPDPPGDPTPWYRHARAAFGLLQAEIDDLAKYPPSERKVDAINDAREKLGRLGDASDGASARTALAAMKLSIRRLS